MTERLHRALGAGAVLFYCFGDILGAGIYALVGEVAAVAGRATPLAFGVSLAVASLTAMSYAEVGSRYPRSGVEVFLTEKVFGRPRFALLVGWTVLFSAVVSAATVSHAFADYLLELSPVLPRPLTLTAFLLVAASVNFWGIDLSSRTNILFTTVEASGLLVVVVAGLSYLFGSPSSAAVAAPVVEGGAGLDWSAIAQGAALAFFAFVGFEDVVNVAEEVKRPERNFARGILGAVALAGLLYVVVGWVATRVLEPATLGQAEGPLVEVVRTAAPVVPPWLFTLVALFAVANTGLLNTITASRLLYGISRQGLLPAWLGAVHGGRRTPHHAILVVFLLSLALALSGTLAYLAGTTSVLLLLVFSAVNLALVRLKWHERRGQLDAAHETPPGGFRVPLVVPILAVGTSLALMTQVPTGSLLRALLLTGAGVVVVAFHKVRSRPSA